MRTTVPTRLALFAAALAAAFAVAYSAGAVTDPIAPATEAASGEGMDEGMGSDEGMGGMAHGGEEPAPAAGAPEQAVAAATLPGLTVAQDGYTMRPADVTLTPGEQVGFSFVITGPDGAPVQQYRPTHDKEMHLIAVRRDLTGFQHLHPERDAAGAWSVPVDLTQPGAYRMYADFAPAALAETLTLGVDAFVPGEFAPVELPSPASTATVDGGYEVALAGSPRPGEESDLTFTVTKDGAEVTDLEPYLAAFGHLVSLRQGDLAYLHTHPAADAAADALGGPAITFGTTFPTDGAYRLFLNFAHAGQVRTAAFTVDVPASAPASAGEGQAPPAPAAPVPAAPTTSTDSGDAGHSGH